MGLINRLSGIPIYIATETYQRRKHRKCRINKKWLKRYGMVEIDKIPKGTVISCNGVLYMTLSDFKLYNRILKGEKDGVHED